ncbi:MAG: energy transducer TonB [Candidatus Marinimicrobia bacterium]|nr:energy transducer TonB [Candidatus Neomarinimicrobiota bacterium]
MAQVKKFEELKKRSPLIAEISSVLVMLILVGAFYFVPKVTFVAMEIEAPDIMIETVDIPITEKVQQEAPPARPTVPVMAESEEIAEDIEFDDFSFDEYEALDAPPPPSSGDDGPRVKFIPYDEPPTPIGGSSAIMRNVKYPDIAREAQIEGTVIVQAYVNEKGIVTDWVIMKGIANTGLDEAAVNAIKKTKFKPAKQRDRDVGVWIAIPIVFKLKD